jgi:hypothetical protein
VAKVWKLADAGLMIDAIKKDVHKAAMEGLLAAAYRVVAHIVSTVIPSRPHPPVDRGAYRAGWRARKDREGAIVENVAPHAAVVEYGARAANIKIGRAMITALAAWVKRKGIGGRIVTSKDGSTRHIKATNTEATSIAWAIAMSMKKKGIFPPKGLRVLEEASKEIPKYMREEIGRRLEKI